MSPSASGRGPVVRMLELVPVAPVQSLPPLSHGLLSVCPKDTVTGFRAHLYHLGGTHLKILNLIAPAEEFFQIKSQSQGPDIRTQTSFLRG